MTRPSAITLACLLIAGTCARDAAGQTPVRAVSAQASTTRQAPKPTTSADSPWSIDLGLSLSRSAGATWWEVLPSVTGALSDHWSVEVGAPFYFVSAALTDDGVSHAGIGDVYGSVSADFSTDTVTFSSTIWGSAATGNSSRGLGAGEVIWQWTNHLATDIGRLTPFVDAGFSNALDYSASVSQNRAFGARGASSVSGGTLFNGEGGAEFSLSDRVSLSLSGYITRGSVSQTTTTRQTPQKPGGPGGQGGQVVTTTTISHDDAGVSAALWGGLARGVDFSFTAWRSSTFHYNTLSAGITLNLPALFKRP